MGRFLSILFVIAAAAIAVLVISGSNLGGLLQVDFSNPIRDRLETREREFRDRANEMEEEGRRRYEDALSEMDPPALPPTGSPGSSASGESTVPPPAEDEDTSETPPAAGETVRFDTATELRYVEAREFWPRGIKEIKAAPQSAYCSDAVATLRPANWGNYYPVAILTTNRPNLKGCSGTPVEISFLQPVRQVTVYFSGCKEPYKLTAYDEGGAVLVSKQQRGPPGPFVGGRWDERSVAVGTGRSNIDRITFGREKCATLITHLSYLR